MYVDTIGVWLSFIYTKYVWFYISSSFFLFSTKSIKIYEFCMQYWIAVESIINCRGFFNIKTVKEKIINMLSEIFAMPEFCD